MLSRDRVLALAERHGLQTHADRLAERVRPGYRLEPQREGAPGPGESKIGGHPDLATGEDWPRNHRGIALTFLAQVDCSRLAPPAPWEDPRPWRHDGGLLRVFADLVDNPSASGLAFAMACDPSAATERTPAPPIPDPFPQDGEWDHLPPEERFRTLPEAPVRLRPLLTAPELDPTLKPEMFDVSDPAEAYETWAMELRGDGSTGGTPAPWEVHHLLGEPVSLQDDVLTTGAWVYGGDAGLPVVADPALHHRDAWRVLLCLHDDERLGLHIHDAGAFTVLAPVADLARGRYDRLVCSVDSC